MPTTTQNPYKSLGTQFSSGLANVIAALPGSPTVDNLISKVSLYVKSVYYGSATAFNTIELDSILPNALNGYTNNDLPSLAFYSQSQKFAMTQLLEGLNSTPVDSVKTYIQNFEDYLSQSDLTQAEQIPLLMATAIGTSAYDYWVAEIANSGSAWLTYFSTNFAVNNANIPYWVRTTMEGVLLSSNNAQNYGLLDPPQIVGVNLVSALTAGLGMSAGKVIFKWIPRINPNFIRSTRINMSSARENNEAALSKRAAWCAPTNKKTRGGNNCCETSDTQCDVTCEQTFCIIC